LILLAALCWAANILYVRAHKWVSTPFQLTFWQTLLATYVLAAFFNGETITPQIVLFAAAVVATVAISTRTRGRNAPRAQ
jgi:drug/metabolite transporter (DMT)-like permease